MFFGVGALRRVGLPSPVATSRERMQRGPQHNNNNNNQRFWWQEPPGKIIFVLFCIDTRKDEEKEIKNINVVRKSSETKQEPEAEPFYWLAADRTGTEQPRRSFGAQSSIPGHGSSSSPQLVRIVHVLTPLVRIVSH